MTDGSAPALDKQPPGPRNEPGDIPACHNVAQRCVALSFTSLSITITPHLSIRV